jgi:hypothetical protein
MSKKENRIVSHVVSLVLGIISIVTILFWYISMPSGIISIVLGAKSYKRYDKKVGLAGMITGIVGLSLCLLIYISLIIIVIIENNGYL